MLSDGMSIFTRKERGAGLTASDKIQRTRRIDRNIKKQEGGKTQEGEVSGEDRQTAWQLGHGQSGTATTSLSPDAGQ